MKKQFTYSILQYRHSIALAEALNVGILFAFPNESRYEFIYSNGNRLKLIYADFDGGLYSAVLKSIEYKLKERSSDLFAELNLKSDIKEFIRTQILREDSTSLQFTKAVVVQNVFKTPDEAIQEFTKLLLPGVNIHKYESPKQKEEAIIRSYTNLVFSKAPGLENRFEKNYAVVTDTFTHKFDLAWENGQLNLVKAISFDLSDKGSIQSKAITNLGYLTALRDFAKAKNVKFDLLVQPPKLEQYYVPYKDALTIINSADTDKEVISIDRLEEFSQRTVAGLVAHG
jgi:hypothetical protein